MQLFYRLRCRLKSDIVNDIENVQKYDKKEENEMSLQFILGSSGAGKSYTAFQEIIAESIRYPDRSYLILVPEQFTMQTQRELVSLHPSGAIMNIDVLSFQRLAYRVFEEVGKDCPPLLEETGKALVLQKIAQERKDQLGVLGGNMKKPGYISEMKSMISELMQYRITPDKMDEIAAKAEQKPLLYHKLRDIQKIYEGFKEYLENRHITSEEILEILSVMVSKSKWLKNSTVVLDGFTGFTPVQNNLIRSLLEVCPKIQVLVTLAPNAGRWKEGAYYQLFHMSKSIVRELSVMAEEVRIPVEKEVRIENSEKGRFRTGSAMDFLEKNIFRPKPGKYENAQDEIFITAAPDPIEEMEETAREIRRLVREEACRYRDIAIITGDLEGYGSYVEQVLGRERIPFFMDRKHSVLMNPFVEFIRAIMDAAVSNFSYESVFRYLRSGMSSLNHQEIDMMENYVIALGIRGFKKWDQHWIRSYKGMDKTLLEPLNQIRERFLGETGVFVQEFRKTKATVKSRVISLYTFIEKNGIQSRLKERELYFRQQGETALVKEYAQIYGIIMELLDKIVEVLGEEQISPNDFQQILEAGFMETQIGIIPPGVDQILVGDMERTRLADIKYLFFVGVNEGIIPQNDGSGGILSEAEREFLHANQEELSPGARENMYTQRFYLYLNMTKPSRRLYLSYAKTKASGESAGAAYLIGLIKRMFPGITEKDVQPGLGIKQMETPTQGLTWLLEGFRRMAYQEPEAEWKELYSWYLQQPEYAGQIAGFLEAAFYENPQDPIGKSAAQALYGKVLENSATRLERFASCAFAHFLEYGLRISERAQYEFNAMDMGNVMHESLEQFSKNLRKESRNWRDLEEEDRNRLIETSVDEIIDDYGNTILHSSARNEYMIERVKRMMRRTVWALQEQISRGDFEPGGFETSFAMEEQLEAVQFTLSEEESLRLRGRIDRMDVCEDQDRVYVKVIDYKSGNQSLDLIELYHGLQLQLVVYMNAALEIEQKKHPDKEVEPAGVFYYNIKDPVISGTGSESDADLQRAILKDLRMNGLVSSDPSVLEKIDRTLDPVTGKSSQVIPVTLNKDRSLSKASAAAAPEKFKILSRYVNRKILEIGSDILQGKVQSEPYELGRKNGCTYCRYQGICGFDERIRGFAYRRLEEPEEEQLWKLMDEGVQ